MPKCCPFNTLTSLLHQRFKKKSKVQPEQVLEQNCYGLDSNIVAITDYILLQTCEEQQPYNKTFSSKIVRSYTHVHQHSTVTAKHLQTGTSQLVR